MSVETDSSQLSDARTLPQMMTLFDSFHEPLPVVGDEYRLDYRRISANSASTRDSPAVIVWTPEDPADLLRIALRRLREDDPVLQAHKPEVEDSHLLRTEADVIRASTMQLLHPVNMALSRLFEGLFCISEMTNGLSRTDIRWMYRDGATGHRVTVAILEFKNTRVLRWDDFQPACAENREDVDRITSQRAGSRHGTVLERNAVWLSKQVTKYRDVDRRDGDYARVDDIALFDWYKMMIFDFSDEIPRGIQFEEEELGNCTDPGLAPWWTFRTMLLGFVVRALLKRNFNTNPGAFKTVLG